jgi:crossover junction endodeoxyribonuclease RuvC
LIKSKAAGSTIAERFRRFTTIVDRVVSLIIEAEPAAVFLEGYSYGSKGRAVITLGEFGGVLRRDLLCRSPRGLHMLVEVPPPTLKLFAAGRGNADKVAVATSLVRRYGVEYDTDHEYDAFAVARLGACCLGWDEPATAQQRKAVASVLTSHPALTAAPHSGASNKAAYAATTSRMPPTAPVAQFHKPPKGNI